jgi:hypothetical protein
VVVFEHSARRLQPRQRVATASALCFSNYSAHSSKKLQPVESVGIASTMNALFITGEEDLRELSLAVGQCSSIHLSRKSLAVLLQRYLSEEFSLDALVELANVLEMNERLNVGESEDELINNALFYLANPEINGAPSEVELLSMIDALRE